MRIPVAVLAIWLLAGCGTPPPQDDHGHDHGETTWPITVWGDRFEIFAELAPLTSGVISRSHTHVTDLETFAPLTEGKVSVLLRAKDGSEAVFSQHRPARPGIFDVGVQPKSPGPVDLVYRIERDGQVEDIPAGRVVIGDGAPGRMPGLRGADSGEAVSFLKEQQWTSDFAVVPLELGALHPTLTGPALVVPAAGGDVLVTASMHGLVTMDPWPYEGFRVEAGEVLLQLLPLVAGDESLPRLQAQVDEAQADLLPLQGRLRRLEELHARGGASDSQLEEARAEVTALEAHLTAAREDLASARSVRAGVASGKGQELRAPLTGAVSHVYVTRGEVVEAGDPLMDLVRPAPLWIEVQLRPRDALRVTRDPVELHVHRSGEAELLLYGPGEVTLVSVAPEVDEATGRVTVILAVPSGEGFWFPGWR